MMDEQPPPQPLEYRPPRDDREVAPRFGYFVGSILGLTLYFGIVALLVAFGLLVQPPVSMVVMAGVALMTAATVLSIYANARWGWRGLFLGMMLGLGLTLLIPGLCFVAFSRW